MHSIKSFEDTLLRRRVLTGKYFLLANFLTRAVEHPQLISSPLLDRFLYAKVDTLQYSVAETLPSAGLTLSHFVITVRSSVNSSSGS